MKLIFVALLLALSVSPLAVFSERHHVWQRRSAPPSWNIVGRSHPDKTVTFSIALKQQNLDRLDSLFWATSTPGNPQYGRFMTIEEIRAIVSPKDVDVTRVLNWLAASGVPQNRTRNLGDALKVRTSVRVAEQLFETEFYGFVHETGREIVRQFGSYSIPEELKDVIVMVTGVSDFPMGKPSVRRNVAKGLGDSPAYVVPETIDAMYNIGDVESSSSCSQSAIEFQDDSSYNKDDLAEFYKETNVKTTPITEIVGPYSGEYPDIEATLDVQYITSVGLNDVNWYWTEENWMYDYASNFFNAKNVPDVVSMSWGWSEAAQCQIDSKCSTLGIQSNVYVDRVNTEFQKIGLRGISLIVASGDSGANGRTDGGCTDTKLHPDYPAASPFVTSVGATQVADAKALDTKDTPSMCSNGYSCIGSGVEQSVSYDVAGFASGGGFSEVSPRQSYQDSAVENYLNTAEDLPPCSYFNKNGRGYPDIAALGNNFLIYVSGEVMPVGGTSASAPTIAGIVSILNSVRVSLGQSKLGFLNPFLYKMAEEHPAAFYDVTVGDNICTEDGCSSTCKGFKAAKGWDPVSGLGTPNVAEMISYIKGETSNDSRVRTA